MAPRRYPVWVLFSFGVAASFLGMGRVALRALHFARTSPSSIEAPRLAGLTSGLKPGPPGLATPSSQANRPAPSLQAPGPAVPAAYPLATAASANFSLPSTFEPAGGTAGQARQYVGRGKGITVLLELRGVGANTTPGRLQLRLPNDGSLQSASNSGTPNSGPSAPPRHRSRRSGPASKPRTRRRRNRQNVPRRNAPGHKRQTPRRERAPRQPIPRHAKPTGQLETPGPNDTNSEANFAWQGVTALCGESNHFLGSDPAKWRTHVKPFAAAECGEGAARCGHRRAGQLGRRGIRFSSSAGRRGTRFAAGNCERPSQAVRGRAIGRTG
jgi:hypothetical protein